MSTRVGRGTGVEGGGRVTEQDKDLHEVMWLIYEYDPRPAMCRYCGALLGYHLPACRYWVYGKEKRWGYGAAWGAV